MPITVITATLLSYKKNKWKNLTNCKFETLKQIDTQRFRIDCVDERNVRSKFGENPFAVAFLANG